MSVEHDNLPVNPRLDTLLRQIVAANDLQPEQNQRVRAQLGLDPYRTTERPTMTLPASQLGPIRTPEQEGIPMIATTRARVRQQWLQFALASVAFIAVGVALALLFGSGSDDPETQPGGTADPSLAVRGALAPLPPSQERRIVLDVEAHTEHDNAFDRWSVEVWERWSPDGVLDQGLYVSDPAGEVVAHIVLDGQQPLMSWEPHDALQSFDVPLEYSLQSRVLGAALAAVSESDSYSLRSEERDGRIVLNFEWQGDGEPEYRDVSRGEIWIDPETERLQRIVYLIDRPDQEPYPSRTFIVRDMEILPVGSSPSGTYDIEGATNSPVPPTATRPVARATATVDHQDPSALPTPDEMGMYNGITLEQAQEIVPFDIVVPESVPDGFDAPTFTVVEAPQVSGEPNYRVELSFGLAGDESPAQSVPFVQRASPPPMTEVPEGMTPLGTFNGINVFQRTEPDAAGDPLVTYQWQHNDVGYLLSARTVGDLTPELLEDLLFAIFVEFTPTAESETARLEQERAAMMPFPIPDTCAASDWAGPDFRVGQQYASAYFIDGDRLSLWTTHGVLFAGDNEITWLADAPLTTTEALSGLETIRAVRTDTDSATIEIPIDVTEQLYNVRDTERAWWSTVSFPSEGCWELEVALGPHSLTATVYVYPQPSSGEFQHIDGAVEVDATMLDSSYLPFAASDAVGAIHVVEGEPMEVIPYYNLPPQSMREQGWTGGGFQSEQYVAYNGWNNGERIVLITVIPGRAMEMFADELQEVDLGPFADEIDDLDSNENLIYTRSAVCEEPTMADCMQAGFDEVFDPKRQP